MAQYLTSIVAARPDDEAIVGPGGTRTWRGLDARVNRWVHLLRGLGLGRGDPVAMVIGNRVETFEAILACLHAGLVIVPVNWHLTPAEAAAIVADAGCAAVLAEPATAALAAESVAALPEPARVRVRLVTGERDRSGLCAVEPLLAETRDTEPDDQLSGTIMMYTSGSTGQPRGVRNNLFVEGASPRRLARLLDYAASVLRVPGDGASVLQVGPWYHSSQLYFALMPLLRGCRLLLHERFDAAAVLATLAAERVAACHLVPTQLIRLLGLPPEVRDTFRADRLNVVWHGGGPCPPQVKRAMIEWWGPILLEYYGATEGGVASLIDSTEWLARPGSVGRAAPYTELLVVDDDGRPVPAGVTGRVFLRRAAGRGFEYHRAPEATARAHLGPGTFTYGELGHLDEDGYLYLVGRAKDRIVSGGVNIYPAEIEAVLLRHPWVLDAAVIGVPDPEFAERPLALVEPHPTAEAGDDLATVLEAHCRRHLAGFKVPRAYRVVSALPRDASGKLRKAELRRRWGSR
ncbi:AMP-binding protein [Micromonospora sp. FIMYZ51]|uniref:AMP-binding protein n=1 Tax=Micromonospora sp. FIMYZ51 TaxID=3051832 RepID=UPI00311D36BB